MLQPGAACTTVGGQALLCCQCFQLGTSEGSAASGSPGSAAGADGDDPGSAGHALGGVEGQHVPAGRAGEGRARDSVSTCGRAAGLQRLAAHLPTSHLPTSQQQATLHVPARHLDSTRPNPTHMPGGITALLIGSFSLILPLALSLPAMRSHKERASAAALQGEQEDDGWRTKGATRAGSGGGGGRRWRRRPWCDAPTSRCPATPTKKRGVGESAGADQQRFSDGVFGHVGHPELGAVPQAVGAAPDFRLGPLVKVRGAA